MQSIWPHFQPSSVYYCSSESQTSTLRLSARVKHTSVQTHGRAGIRVFVCTHKNTHRHTHFLSHIITHAHNHSLFLSLLLPLSVSLSHTHSSLLPQESDLFIERLCVGVGGGMAVLFHPAQTGSQINILSPAGQLVQAGQTASVNLSLWFHVCRLS